MRKYATIFQFENQEVDGLVEKLKSSGFTIVSKDWPCRHIFGQEQPFDRNMGTGYLKLDASIKGVKLYLLEGEDNPLREFLEKNYEISKFDAEVPSR